MNQLPAGCIDERAVHEVTGPEFHCLAKGANVNRLVAFNTAYVVVSWSKTIFDILAFREDEFVVFESAVPARGGCYRFIDAFDDRCTFDAEAVEQVIGFGVHVSGRRLGCSLASDRLGFAQGYEERDRE